MADAAAVILSVIEELDSLLLQKTELRDDDYAKLCSLWSEKKDLLVGMMEVWRNDTEMLYNLVALVAWPWDVKAEKFDNDKLYSFLGEMEDLWELNCREKLCSLLVQMLDLDHNKDHEKLFSLAFEMVDLWKDGKGKLNKEKLYTWLAKETDLWEEDEVFRLLEDMTFVEEPCEWRKLFDEEGWKKKLEGVRDDLRFILDFFNKLEDQDHLHYFMSDVVEMAHDVQLLVHLKYSDPFLLFIEILNFHVEHTFKLTRFFEFFFDKIKLIHERLQETKERLLKFGSDETSQINNVREESDHHVVGLKEEVELLLRNTKTTIRVVGLPGSGKTTLAREFYNHPLIVKGFECRAWVCLTSWKLSRKELLIKLIRQFIHSKREDMVIEKMENKALRQMLRQHLQDKPYVLVLDDVSEVTYLRYVFRTLPQDKRSRLLFTTRIHETRCNINPPYEEAEHKMKNLDEDESWQLIWKSIFFGNGDHEEFPKQLVKRGREMLMRKCNGLPLAIKEMGRLWVEKRRSGSEWKQVVESSMDLELSKTLAALESTYLNMDSTLQAYFLALAFFKEGTIIRYKKLQHIMTALEEPEHYENISELMRLSIIEEVDETKNDIFTKKFRINAVLHRLSIRKAVDEIGFEILRKDGSNRASHEPPHHRVMHCGRDDKFNYNYSSTNQDEHLVSLFFHGGGGYSSICHPSYWKHFAQLRVLDMEGFGLKMLPETIGDLTELRYLGLRNNYIQELPQSLVRLKMLEVLDIAQNFMVEVPDILWEMDSLRHLYMSDITCQKPLKIEALMNLETLTYISVNDLTYDMKIKMPNLCRLGIEEMDGNSNVRKILELFEESGNLKCLYLRGFRFRSMPCLDILGDLWNITELKLEGRLTKLPSDFPPKVYNLSLVNSCLDEDPIPILEKLRRLCNLSLQNAYTGHEMVISDGFPNLSSLVIREFWNLRNVVKVGEGGLGYLQRVEINSCPYLKTVPQEILSELDHLRSQSLKCATP